MGLNNSLKKATLLASFLWTLIPPGRVAAQEVPAQTDSSLAARNFGRYESMKKDKGSALAWSILVPGGSVFYAGGHPEYAAGIGLIEGASLGGVIYLVHQQDKGTSVRGDRGMSATFVLLYAACKVLEVSHAFSLIDRQNSELWKLIFTRGGGPAIGALPCSGPRAPRPAAFVTLSFPL